MISYLSTGNGELSYKKNRWRDALCIIYVFHGVVRKESALYMGKKRCSLKMKKFLSVAYREAVAAYNKPAIPLYEAKFVDKLCLMEEDISLAPIMHLCTHTSTNRYTPSVRQSVRSSIRPFVITFRSLSTY